MRRADVGGAALSAAVAALVAGALFFGHGWSVRPGGLSQAGVGFLALLGAFVVWQAVSIHWSIQPAGSWDYANRGLVYLAFAFAGGLLGGIPRARIVSAL